MNLNKINNVNNAIVNTLKISQHNNRKKMGKHFTVIIVCVLILFGTSGCTLAKSSPSVTVDSETNHTADTDSTTSTSQIYLEWQENSYFDDDNYPHNDISLKLTGSVNEKIFIITIDSGDVSKASGIFLPEFPDDAILPVYSFYAGGCDFLYIKQKDDTSISVMYKLEFEDDDGDSQFEEIAVIKIPSNCILMDSSVIDSTDNNAEKSLEFATPQSTISAGYNFTIGINSNHNVLATGDNEYGQLDVNNWTDIISVGAGYRHSVGLKSDGMVIATGDNGYGQCDVSDWKNIISISVGAYHTVGLLPDGTVVAVGRNDYGQTDINTWTDIIQISASNNNTLGLKSDGTVVGVGSNEFGQINLGSWDNIVAVSAGKKHSTGLTADGYVLAVGSNEFEQCNTNNWSNIIAIANGGGHSVGLASKGTVIAVGLDYQDRCDVNGWMNIVAIDAGYGHTIGLKNDGTIISVGWNESGQCNTDQWQNIVTE
jgi:hypothetical protein